ncbi:hypothetical protein ACFC14_18795 [Microbacterium sp. NPDC055988]|uniref:hypothetical protein n=1 Tax=Microbacterium sp. NPDC055988 TaxID=3345671 RepID=UPI0035DBAF66
MESPTNNLPVGADPAIIAEGDLPPLQARATLTGQRAVVEIEGAASELVTASDGQDLRAVVVEHVTRASRGRGQNIELRTLGDLGDHRLLITSDGDATRLAIAAAASAETVIQVDDESAPLSADTSSVDPQALFRAEPATALPVAPLPEPSTARVGRTVDVPATPGRSLRTAVSSLGRRRSAQNAPAGADDRHVVAQHLPGCHKIAVVSAMGGQGATVTTAMLGAVFGRLGGGGILAWDDSDALGMLGWRTQPGAFNATVTDMLSATEALLAPDAGVSAIARYVHRQTTDQYDVLRRSGQLFGAGSQTTSSDVDRLLAVAERYYRMVIVDTGKSIGGEKWVQLLGTADQLVVPVLATVEAAEAALTFLDQLAARDARSAKLVAAAVVVLTEWPLPVNKNTMSALSSALGETVGAVEVLRFDGALKSGDLLFDRMNRATQDTFLAVAAHAARGMTK